MTSPRPGFEGAPGEPYFPEGGEPHPRGADEPHPGHNPPSHEVGSGAAYEWQGEPGYEAYGGYGAYRAAVDSLADPLTDPLPDPGPQQAQPSGVEGESVRETEQFRRAGSPWFRPLTSGEQEQPRRDTAGPDAHGQPGAWAPEASAGYTQPAGGHAGPYAPGEQVPPDLSGFGGGAGYAAAPGAVRQPRAAGPGGQTSSGYGQLGADGVPQQGRTAQAPPRREQADPTPIPAPRRGAGVPLDVPPVPGVPGDDRQTVGLRRPEREELERRPGRRRAAGRKGRASPQPEVRAGTRLEARRAERARRPGPGIIASRFLGEVFISVGVLMLLFVAYQLWWTNVLAGQEAGGAASDLHEQWEKPKAERKPDPERRAGAFEPGEGFALVHIPKIDLQAPIAEGVSKEKVLDKGMVGHYDEEPLKTAMPWDKRGNFALAGHRNTHGEPFRYVNRLVGGDKVVVETSSRYYTYEVTSRLASTSPSNTSVIDPVPAQSGFRKAGKYVTLTTCTPEYTSKYRLIVWGKMVDERPRSEGKPDALIG
ncbi:class E sortase [Streptomyces sulphureus]|uniref:class E sortase n=1 Tax=Streptomyces sulphureus TaxID=47758 RepID=UPI000371E18D|nr:class E sortase [Streptomyces sulphureus]